MSWEDDVEAMSRKISGRLMTPAEFDTSLAELIGRRGSPVTAARINVQGPAPMPAVVVGRPGAGRASDMETWFADEQRMFEVRTELWWGDGDNEAHEVARSALKRLVAAWWRGDGRNEKSRLPSGQNVATQRALEETVRTWLADGPVLFCAADIDNFGHLNDQLGLPAGDALISQLGACLLERLPRDCLVVHRSGDEFCLVFPATVSAGRATAEVFSLRDDVEAVLREGVDLDPLPGLSIGIAPCTESLPYAELEDLAGKALKPEGQKQRGRVSVLRPNMSPLPEGVSPLELQLLFASNFLGEEEPFHDPLLDAASVLAARASKDATGLDDLAGRVRAELARLSPADVDIPPSELVVAAAHGLARAALTGIGPEELDRVGIRTSPGLAEVRVGEAGVVVAGTAGGESARELVVRGAEPELVDVDSRRAVLVTIGDSELGLPADLFAAAVSVDDRPTKGGGLPDLWEAALAQLVACVTRHPNVDRVFLAGALDLGKQTVARLHEANMWHVPATAEALARRLGAPSMARITETGNRIAGRVIEITSASEVVGRMLDDLEASEPLRPATDAEPVPDPPRLRRVLAMDDMLPTKEYGCRVSTALEAFPVALDIVRHVEDDLLEDQTGRGFRELVDFRIQLSQPRIDPVPRFYVADQALLDEYFQREFVDGSGLFRAALEANGQLEAVVSHVAEVVATGRLTSRRALLVVPHVPVQGADLSPLGLVGARMIPRPESVRTVRLHFSFTWRTVEALVGLPYSLYGSIRFAEHLTELIEARLAGHPRRVTMGTLSYIAHSLHMFVDEYAGQVARRIVNDDSL
jgi:diguanylate cyclase (GGDEF)-like protein